MELAWDLKPAVESLARLGNIDEQYAADVLLEVFDAFPGPEKPKNWPMPAWAEPGDR